MKKLYVLAAILLLGFKTFAQPFAIGTTTITFNDPSRSNRTIETDIYYPAVAAGSNVAVAGGQFPIISFGHGFLMTVSAYQNIWTALVPQGYIVALPKTEGGILPNHTNFGRDLAFVISSLQQANAAGTSIFFGKIAGTSAVMGHSMGGGAAMLAVQYNTAITAVAGLAPAETNPAASAAAQQVSLPALIFAGGNDCVTPAAQHSRLIYDNIAADCKYYLSINGGSHCQFANQNLNCSFGEATCSPSASISRTTQQNIVTEYLLPWLNFELKGICAPWIGKQGVVSADTRLTPLASCKTTEICPAPSGRNVTAIKASSAQFNWTSNACAGSYEVRYRPAGTTAWIRKTSTTTNRLVFSLNPSTSYEWQVRAICDSVAPVRSGWGTTRIFTTAALRNGDLSSVTSTLSLFPNPGDGFFHVSGEGLEASAITLHIINAIGQEVFTQTIHTREGECTSTIDLRPLPRGIYIVQAFSGKQYITKRIILQ